MNNMVEYKRYPLVIMWSGGMDTTIAYWYAQKVYGFSEDDILMLYVNYGQPYSWKELRAVDWFRRNNLVKNIRIVNVDLLRKEYKNIPTIDKQVVDGRNLLLAYFGAYWSEHLVWIGALDGEMHKYMKDKNDVFFAMASDILSYVMDRWIVVDTPFDKMSKSEVLKWFIENVNNAEEMVNHTYTCYHPNELACGKCSACFKRWVAYENAGLDWRKYWKIEPWESKEAKKLIEKYRVAYEKKDFSHYSEKRIRETVEALRSVGEEVDWYE